MKTRLISHLQSIQDPALRQTCETILEYDKFFTCPASLSFHHAYEGGLLAHTVEVCDIALVSFHHMKSTELRDPSLNPQWINLPPADILIAAALFHDLLKIEEYDKETWTCEIYEYNKTVPKARFLLASDQGPNEVPVWIHTQSGYLQTIGHICGSAAQFQVAAVNFGVNRKTIDAVTHCILAHHGRKEWGSPVEPQTLEALVLHQADMLSAKFGDTKDVKP